MGSVANLGREGMFLLPSFGSPWYLIQGANQTITNTFHGVLVLLVLCSLYYTTTYDLFLGAISVLRVSLAISASICVVLTGLMVANIASVYCNCKDPSSCCGSNGLLQCMALPEVYTLITEPRKAKR